MGINSAVMEKEYQVTSWKLIILFVFPHFFNVTLCFPLSHHVFLSLILLEMIKC